MKNIEFSVIMPIYNPPIRYLKKSIESVIKQTFKQLELILILDGSNIQIKQICYQAKS